jgi:hypothetical protein
VVILKFPSLFGLNIFYEWGYSSSHRFGTRLRGGDAWRRKIVMEDVMKNFFVVLMTILALAACTGKAAAQTEEDFGVELTDDGNGVVITDYFGSAKAVRIPATIQGMPVLEIGGFFVGPSDEITSVVIPDTVTKIGDFAFFISRLTAITLSKNLKTIGKSAFENCGNLVDISLPAGLTEIGEKAFSNCGALRAITIPEGVTVIEFVTFDGCSALTSVTLPSSIKKIEALAFQNCSALTTLTIPDSVQTIEFDTLAFDGCSRLPLTTRAALKRLGYTGRF